MTNNLTPLPNSSPVNPLIYRVNLRINLSFSTKSEPNSYFDYTDPKTRESSPKQIPIESSLQFQMSKAQDLSPRSAGWKGDGEPVSRANGVSPASTLFIGLQHQYFGIKTSTISYQLFYLCHDLSGNWPGTNHLGSWPQKKKPLTALVTRNVATHQSTDFQHSTA